MKERCKQTIEACDNKVRLIWVRTSLKLENNYWFGFNIHLINSDWLLRTKMSINDLLCDVFNKSPCHWNSEKENINLPRAKNVASKNQNHSIACHAVIIVHVEYYFSCPLQINWPILNCHLWQLILFSVIFGDNCF